MTGKRFECNNGSRIIIDNETKLHYIMTLDWECSLVTKLLNRFAEENEQLKSEIEKVTYANEDLLEQKRNWEKLSDEYAKLYDENEQLKIELIKQNDFKDKVFNLINTKLKEADEGFEQTYDSWYQGQVDALKELKKELIKGKSK